MLNKHIFLLLIGFVLVGYSLFRIARRRISNAKFFNTSIKEMRGKTEKTEDVFGSNVKWVINDRKQKPEDTEKP